MYPQKLIFKLPPQAYHFQKIITGFEIFIIKSKV